MSRQPSRALLIAAGSLTQLIGAACLVLALASLPVLHDLHAGTSSLIASLIAALAALVCGTLVWRGRLVPLALAAGLDVGFGIGLARGSSAIGALLKILPADDADTADAIVTAAAVVMFVASVVCLASIPSAIKLRRWARDEIDREARESLAQTRPSKPADTLKGMGPQKLTPTQVIRIDAPRWQPVVVIGVALTLIAIGIVVITAATGTRRSEATAEARLGSSAPEHGSGRAGPGSAGREGSAAAPVDASIAVAVDAAPAAPVEPPIDELVTRMHAALVHATAADLGLLLDSQAFAFGVEAHEVAEGRDAVVAMLRRDLGDAPARGFDVTARFTRIAHDTDVGWIAEELRVGSKSFVITLVAGLRDNVWTIAALHWAMAMPNETAYRLAHDGDLTVPDAIPDTHDESALGAAMRAAFASKPSFVEARSTRPDAFNFGSAPGERIVGGDAIKKTFARIRATIHLHDAVKVGTVGDKAGWGAANIDFTDTDRDGSEVTQTFRVLAAWVKEDAGWRIVQTQFSNAK